MDNADKQTQDYEQRFKGILDKMLAKFKEKNHDYGGSYAKSIHDLGFVAGFTPIYNKCNRMTNLLNGTKPKVADETIDDTALDMAVYLAMFLIERDNQRKA